MAVNFQKPGLGGVSFGTTKKTSSTMQQASQNLSTGSATAPNAFSFRGTRRAGFVSGQNTIKGRTQYNFQGARAALNPRTYVAPAPQRISTPITSGGTTNVKIDNGSDYMKGQIIGGVIGGVVNGIFGMLNKQGAVDSVAAPRTTAGAQLNSAMEGLGAVNTAVTLSSPVATAALNAMTQATTAGDLSQAITNAESQYSTMQAQDGKLKAAADTAQKNLQTLQDNVGKEEANVKGLETTISDGEQQLNGLKAELNKLDGGYRMACDDVDSKTTLYENAQKNVASAQQGLDQANALPADDPTKAEKVAKATKNLESAKSAEALAKKNLDDAEKTKRETFDKLGAKKDDVKKAEDNIKAQKEDIKNAKAGLDDAKKKLEKAKQDLEGAKSAIKAYTDNAKDMAALGKAIQDNKKRLAKLQESEQRELGKLNNQIQDDEAQNAKLNGNINGADGYSKREIRNMDKIQRNNAENEVRRGRASEIISSQLKMQTPTRGTDGNDYRKLSINGETYYSKNNQMITEEEYNAALGA